MLLRFAALGSGSEGNGWLVEADGANAGGMRWLVDCGFSLRETERRLARLGVDPSTLNGVLVTHEHGDHAAGVARLASRHSLDVWMSRGTRAALRQWPEELTVSYLEDGQVLALGGLEITSFSVPHDAREPLQYRFKTATSHLAILTDTGHVTPYIRQQLQGCDALVVEFNHDPERLAQSSYPPSLKRRIAGFHGHLPNADALNLLQSVACDRLQQVVAAHLSHSNNCPEQVFSLLESGVRGHSPSLTVATQDEGTNWIALT